MYSLQRRRERYRIIYIWRVLEGQVPNIGNHRITCKTSDRRGRECVPPKVSTGARKLVQNLVYASLPQHGQRLFNCLPKEIRNVTGCKVESFKNILDRYLMTVPDEPLIRGYTSYRRAESNSLIDMVKLANKPGDIHMCENDESPTTTGVVHNICLE